MPLKTNNNFFLEKYLENLKNKYTWLSEKNKTEMIKNIKENSEKIFSEIKTPENKTILLTGNVQSGKTATLIGLISKVFENNFSNFVIFLAGVNKNLYWQNLSRIKESFSDIYFLNKIFVFGDKLSNFSSYFQGDSSKKIIVILLKNHHWISNFLKKLSENDKKYIINPILIDDEGDQFSFNNVKIYKKLNENSATYSKIKNVFEHLTDLKLLTVTATPYAHILASTKYGDDDNILKPDSFVITKPNNGYVGLDFFVSGIEGLSTTRTVGKDDEELVSKYGEIVDSFKKATTYFFVYGLIYHHNVMNGNAFSEMIINISRKNDINKKVRDKLLNYISNIFLKKIYEKDSVEYNSLENAIDEYNNYCINNYEKEIFQKEKEMYPDEIKKWIKEDIEKNNFNVELLIQNFSKKQTLKKFNFYIGSLKISRGYTFNNLIVSYALKRNKKIGQMDTILQMCRWFGYREDYKFLLRLWTSNALQKDFSNILIANDVLLEKLEEFSNQGKNIKDLNSLFIPQDDYEENKMLKGTRETVVPQRIIEAFSNFKTSYTFKEEISYQNINRKIFEFEKKIINLINQKPFVLNEHFDKIDNYPSVYIKTLDDFKKILGNELVNDLNFVIFDKNKNNLDIWKILAKHFEICEGLIISIMTGKNTDRIDNFTRRKRHFINNKILGMEKGETSTYYGDKNWGKHYPNYIFCQIHSIIPTDGTKEIKINDGLEDLNLKEKIIYKLLLSYKNQESDNKVNDNVFPIF